MAEIRVEFDAQAEEVRLYRQVMDKHPSHRMGRHLLATVSAEEAERLVGSAVLMLLQQAHGSPVAGRDYEAVANDARSEMRESLRQQKGLGDLDAALALLQNEVSEAMSSGADCFEHVQAGLENLVANGHEEARTYLLDRLPRLKLIWSKRHGRAPKGSV
jgi:hypothetical protein